MRVHMSKLTWFLSLILLFIFFSCGQGTKQKGELTDYITKSTTSVWNIEDWSYYDALMQTQFATSSPKAVAELEDLLKHLALTKPGLITANYRDSLYHYSLIAPQDSLLLPTDTSLYKISSNANISTYTHKDYSFYAGIQDSIILVSTNKEVLDEMLSKEKTDQIQVKKFLEVKAKSKVSGLRRSPQHEGIAEWSILDYNQTQEGFLATGILQSADSLGYWSNLIYGQKPQVIQLAKYTPSQANYVWGLTYQNTDLLQKQLERYSNKTFSEEEELVLESSEEVGCIGLPNGNAFAIKSLEEESFMQLIAADVNLEENFRETPIYKVLNDKTIKTLKSVLCDDLSVNWLVALDNYFIFTSEKETAKSFVSSYLNNHHLADSPIYKKSVESLSANASLLYFSLDGHFPKDIQKHTSLEIFGNKSKLDKVQFPLLVLQLNAEKDFSHLNFLAYQSHGEKLQPTRVTETFQIKVEERILKGPIYFSNHLNHRKDILVQDQANNLHLYNSTNGKEYWTKKLDNPILGEVHEIDLYRNGRKQLAFTTKDGLYVLDRTGKEVSPFPIKYKDEVTQGLAVFDYNNNKDYRMLVIQGKDILMYDKNAKIVKGFGYKKAASNIIMPPQHLRIGNLDYLIFAEENGKLQIRNRVGKERINVMGTYDIKPQAVEIERGGIVFYTNQREKINVSNAGAISKQTLEEDFYKTTKHGVTAFIQAQKLRINQVEIELPFGIYTDPEIYSVGNQAFVTLTDTQESKVYVYNAKGTLLQGFPVYGKGLAFLADADKNGKPNLIVQTEEDSLTQYSVE